MNRLTAEELAERIVAASIGPNGRLEHYEHFSFSWDSFAQKQDTNPIALRMGRATMPYTREEMLRILAAIGKYRDVFPNRGRQNALRLRGLILLLRYSGMRIGDAVSLTRDRINGDRLFLYTQKTGVAVNTVLPDFVLKALEATPRFRDEHFF